MKQEDKNILLGMAMIIGIPVIVTIALLLAQAVK